LEVVKLKQNAAAAAAAAAAKEKCFGMRMAFSWIDAQSTTERWTASILPGISILTQRRFFW